MGESDTLTDLDKKKIIKRTWRNEGCVTDEG